MNNSRVKRCGLCSENKLLSEFPMMNPDSIFHTEGFGPICYKCCGSRINPNDLDEVNKFCQLLDIRFMPDSWIKIAKYQVESIGVSGCLEIYVDEMRQDKFATSNWEEQNKQWDKARECAKVLDELPELRLDLLVYLKKKWGAYENFSMEDYMRVESYERHTLNHYNFRDEARRDLVRKLALLSIMIDKKMVEGDIKELTSMITAYNSLMKESGIQSAVEDDTSTLTSISEIVAHLEKTGFLLNYKIEEDRDIVDKTIRNMEMYVQRLFNDSSETVREKFEAGKVAAEAGTDFSEEDLEMMFDEENRDEDGIAEEEALSEDELMAIFNEVDKTYGAK